MVVSGELLCGVWFLFCSSRFLLLKFRWWYLFCVGLKKDYCVFSVGLVKVFDSVMLCVFIEVLEGLVSGWLRLLFLVMN